MKFFWLRKNWVKMPFFLLLWVNIVFAQELNCRINVLTPNIQGVDRAVFTQFQQDITQYINNRRWTNDRYEEYEKIKCSFTITITALPSSDRFEGTIQVQVIRPAYNSTYETVVLNLMDKDFKVNYVPFQVLEYSENSYLSNLTSILNFYANLVLAMDYNCMTLKGGNPYFERCRNIVNLANNSPERGWRAADDGQNRNRYWFLENLTNNSYAAIHSILYKYHREGIDKLENDVNAGRAKVLESLLDLQKLFVQNPNIYFIQVFNETKSRELVGIFSKATPGEKQQFIRIMSQIDPSNLNSYNGILKN